MEEILPAEGYKSPRAIAASMAKRYNQIRMALPKSENAEIFALILDNRYKLLGNLVPQVTRKDIVLKAANSLSGLTLLTILQENKEAVNEMRTDDELYYTAIDLIHRTIQKEAPSSKPESFDDFKNKAFHFVHGG